MKCDKCNSLGMVDNKRYWNYGSAVAYERGIESMIKCKTCKGMGYVGIDLNRIKETMTVIYNNTSMEPYLKKELEYMLNQFKPKHP